MNIASYFGRTWWTWARTAVNRLLTTVNFDFDRHLVTFHLATPFEMAVAFFGDCFCGFNNSSTTTELVATVRPHGVEVAFPSRCPENVLCRVFCAKIGTFLEIEQFFLADGATRPLGAQFDARLPRFSDISHSLRRVVLFLQVLANDRHLRDFVPTRFARAGSRNAVALARQLAGAPSNFSTGGVVVQVHFYLGHFGHQFVP